MPSQVRGAEVLAGTEHPNPEAPGLWLSLWSSPRRCKLWTECQDLTWALMGPIYPQEQTKYYGLASCPVLMRMLQVTVLIEPGSLPLVPPPSAWSLTDKDHYVPFYVQPPLSEVRRGVSPPMRLAFPVTPAEIYRPHHISAFQS